MNRILLGLIGVIAFAGASSAQTQQQDSTTISSGPFRFGVSGGPSNSFNSSAARYERDNPVNQLPWSDRMNAAPSGEGPKLGPEGGGTPMSRGGVNDTLTGSNAGATLNAPQTAKPKAKPADKSAKAQSAAPKP